MMRVVAFVVLVGYLLAGCSGGEPKSKLPNDAGDFDVAATETTGILVGVVVDEAIRPLDGASVRVTGPNAEPLSQTTDDSGRFAFEGLEPGTYFIMAALLNYGEAQSTAEVVAGDEDPRIHRVQLTRLFSETAFSDMIKFDGFLQCAYAIGVSSTCVNDYTRVTGTQCVPQSNPPQCYCQGGCFRDQNLAAAGGNIREYVSTVGPGWQVIIWEAVWKPTSQFGEELGFTVSYFSRPNAGHNFGGTDGPSPLRFEEPVGDTDGSSGSGEPEMIPAEGYDELFTFFSAAGGGVALNQAFTSFETHFYYGLPPEGWSFVAGDPPPF